MTILLYILNVACSAGQSTLSKSYSSKGGNAATFNTSNAFAGVLMFLLFGLLSGMSFHVPSLLFGLGYGIFLCISMYTGFRALAMGPMALTSIIASFSLIIPFLFGITVWKEPLSLSGAVGILLILCSIVLLNFKKEQGITLKWFLFALITLLTNGICSLIQKYHQLDYPGLYRNEFMLCALLCVLLFFFAAQKVRPEQKQSVRLCRQGLLSGVINGLANYLLLYLAATEKASVLFPVTSVAKVIAVWIIGRLLFKERLNLIQTIGLAAGLLAVVLLNLQR